MNFFVFLTLISVAFNVFAADAPNVERSKAIDQALATVETSKKNLSWQEANADKPYVSLLNEYSVKVNNDWSYDEDYHARVKIQTEAGKELGEWPVYYNSSREEIVDIKAFVETADGKKYDAGKAQDTLAFEDSPMYADMKVKLINLPQVEVGSVIDVQVKSKVSAKDIANQFWDKIIYPAIPTKLAHYRYTFPEDKAIKFKSTLKNVQPVVEKKNGMISYALTLEETRFTSDDDFVPPVDEVAGVMSFSSVSDWKDIADWYRELINKNTVDDPDISVKAIELTKDKTTQKDKARAILEFIQDKFRYVSMALGDHSSEMHGTTDVFKNHYGDCKDLVLLARQMMKIVGIEANICLFSGEFNGDPQRSLPSSSVFDHMVLELTLDGQKIVTDTQAKGFDFGQFPSSYDGAYLMVIDAAGYRFEGIPAAKEDDHVVSSSSEITINEDGSALFDVRVQMPIEASQGFKNTWAATTADNKDKFFESLEANFIQGGKIIDRQVKGIDSRYGVVEFSLKYEAPNAYPLVNDMILLKEVQQGDIPNFAALSRQFDLFIPNNSLIRNRNTYHFPDGLKIDFIPADYDLTSDFMEVSMKYAKGENNTITVDGFYRMKRVSLPVGQYGQVKNFRDEILRKSDQYIVLKKKSNASPEAKEWIKKQ